jgi:hypothetical protein
MGPFPMTRRTLEPDPHNYSALISLYEAESLAAEARLAIEKEKKSKGRGAKNLKARRSAQKKPVRSLKPKEG